MSEIIHLFTGVVIAFIVAIPVGPVNLAVVQNSVRYGMFSGLKIALGSALAEFFYCFIGLWGVKSFLDHPTIFLTLKIVSIPVLVILGIYNLLRKKETEEQDQQAAKTSRGDIFLGASLTLMNPILLPFWMGVAAYLRTLTLFGENFHFLHNRSTSWAFIVGVASGSFLFLALVSLISSKKANHNVQTKIVIYRVLGVLFLALAFVQVFNLLG